MMWPFKRKEPENETRACGAGYTSQIIGAREAYISGSSGLAELTGTVQSCVSLWEGGLALADVTGTDMLDRRSLALCGRSLAIRGEAVFLITEQGLVPAVDWALSTRFSKPSAYRLTLPEAGGGRTQTALAGEVLHFRIGCDLAQPYIGTAPLRRCQLSAGLLHVMESALAEVYENAPIGSQIVPFPEAPETDMETLARGFRGNRGRVLIRESVNVQAAGGPAPVHDWKSQDVTPDLSKAMTKETWAAARGSIEMAYGVLPGLSNVATTGPMVREAQRHLAQWTLMPIAKLMAEECTEKMGGGIELDVMRPLQAYDAGGRARTVTAIIQALAQAKEAGVDPSTAFNFVDWKE